MTSIKKYYVEDGEEKAPSLRCLEESLSYLRQISMISVLLIFKSGIIHALKGS